MAQQQSIYQVAPIARVGGLANTSYANPINATPACRNGGTAITGNFVWATSAPAGTQVNTQERYVSNSGSGSPLGFVYRVQDVALSCSDGYTLNIPAGQPVPVAIRGAFYANASTAASVGQKVLASVEDGSIQTGSQAASATAGTLNFVATQTAGSWTSVTSGTLVLAINGVKYTLAGLDFSSTNSLTQIAAVFNTAMGAIGTCALNSATTGLIFTSAVAGSNSSVEYVATVGDIATQLAALTQGNMVATQGTAQLIDTGFVVNSAASIGQLFVIERY